MIKKILITILVLIILAVTLVYTLPSNVVETIMTDNYYFEENDEYPHYMIRSFDTRLFSDETLKTMVNLNLVKEEDLRTEDFQIQTIFFEEYVNKEDYQKLLSEIEVSRKLFTYTDFIIDVNRISFELDLSKDYKAFLGNETNRIIKKGKFLIYYEITNSDEIIGKLIKLIEEGIALTKS